MTIADRRKQLTKFKVFLGPLVWKLYIFTIFVGLAWFFVELGFVYILQIFLRGIGLIEGSQTFIPPWLPNSLPVVVISLITFGIFRSLVLLAKSLISGMINQTFVKEQRSGILTMTLTQHPTESSSEIVALFSERVIQAGAFVMFSPQLMVVSMTSILLTIMGLLLAPVEFLTGVVFLGIFYFPMNALNKYISKAADGIASEWGIITRTLIVGLKNSFLLRLYDREKQEALRGTNALDSYLKHYFSYYKISAFRFILPNIIGIVAISLITTVSVIYMKTSPMKLLSLFYLFIRLSQNVSEITTYLNDSRLFLPSFKSVFQFIQKYDRTFEDVSKLNRIEQQISPPIFLKIEKLTFGYSSDHYLFKMFSAEVKTGELLLLKGESGTGKSTLLALMAGLLKPSHGQVLINGRSADEARTYFSNMIAYVGPDPYLLSGTVRQNLMYPDVDIKLDDGILWSALKESYLNHVIEELPGGLDHMLLEETQLSTGQKQRLALARALIRKPTLLILDEATANIDSETEAKIIQTLLKRKSETLIIVVSHRPAFDQIADQVITLNPIIGSSPSLNGMV